MTPYYEDESVTIYNGRCEDIIHALEFDVIVSDPPYGISYKTSYGTRRGAVREASSMPPVAGDEAPFDPRHLLGFDDVLLWGANHFCAHLANGRWLVWDKRCGVAPTRTQGDCEFAWHSRPGPARVIRHLWDGMIKQGAERGAKRYHPTQKPVSVMGWCLDFVGPGVVLDPYMGSGSTLVAAQHAGRGSIGIEVSREYCDVAIDRLRQKSLFSP